MTRALDSVSDLSKALEAWLPAERIHTDELTLTVYARCADFYEIRPRVVVKARSEAEVIGVLSVANAFRVPVTFRAAGTSLSGQTLGTGIVCDISTGFQRIAPGRRRSAGKVNFDVDRGSPAGALPSRP